MTAVVAADGLGKRYGRKWALSECTLAIPAGKVVGLVGPNGAGKTTLLQLSVGLLQPTTGSITVLGGPPGTTPGQLARIGFVAQDTPTYAGLSIAEHLRFGQWMNPTWDPDLAGERIEQLGLDPRQKAEAEQHRSSGASTSSPRPSTRSSPISRRVASGRSSGPKWGFSSRPHWRCAGSPTGGCAANTRDPERHHSLCGRWDLRKKSLKRTSIPKCPW
jgi:ABC-type sugar transport system ATPase subunit